MTVNKQLINLLGILSVMVIAVLGVVLIAMPLYTQAQATDANATRIDQTNAVYQAQIDGLTVAEARLDEIDADLAELRAEIAATPSLDDVYEIITAAAQQSDVRIESITADSVQPWIARTQLDENGEVVAVSPAETPDDSDGETGTETTDGGAATEPPSAAAAGTEASPQQQVLLTAVIDLGQPFALPAASEAEASAGTITDGAADASAIRSAATAQAQRAAAFTDALGAGRRLLLPINLDYAAEKLTLSVLTFIRTEDAQ